MGSRSFAELVACLDPRDRVVVQTHDYPDIDAIASAWGLVGILELRGFTVACAYRGELRSRSLLRLLEALSISIVPAAQVEGARQVIVVDGSPGNGNVDLGGSTLVGVVDHHCLGGALTAPFVDIRPELAACSTIIHQYWREEGRVPSRNVATALLAGIQSDTDFLSRKATDADFEAYAALFKAGDWELASRVVRTTLDLRELHLVIEALGKAEVRNGLFFAMIAGPCGQEALAVLAEFVLRAEDLEAAVVGERDAGGLHLSVRCKNSRLSAFSLVRAALEGIGTGGGHSHSAGGIVPAATNPGEDVVRSRFFTAAARAAATHT